MTTFERTQVIQNFGKYLETDKAVVQKKGKPRKKDSGSNWQRNFGLTDFGAIKKQHLKQPIQIVSKNFR